MGEGLKCGCGHLEHPKKHSLKMINSKIQHWLIFCFWILFSKKKIIGKNKKWIKKDWIQQRWFWIYIFFVSGSHFLLPPESIFSWRWLDVALYNLFQLPPPSTLQMRSELQPSVVLFFTMHCGWWKSVLISTRTRAKRKKDRERQWVFDGAH